MADGEDRSVELRSEEAREVMGRVPPAILRWGTLVMAVIVAALVSVMCFVKIPVTEDCVFTLEWNGNEPDITISLPPSVVRAVAAGSGEVMLESDAFPAEFNGVVAARINRVSRRPSVADGHYDAVATAAEAAVEAMRAERINVRGKAIVTVGERTLVKMLMGGK